MFPQRVFKPCLIGGREPLLRSMRPLFAGLGLEEPGPVGLFGRLRFSFLLTTFFTFRSFLSLPSPFLLPAFLSSVGLAGTAELADTGTDADADSDVDVMVIELAGGAPQPLGIAEGDTKPEAGWRLVPWMKGAPVTDAIG